MDGEEIAIRQMCKDDFHYYAERCLKIRTKDDGLKPFQLNEAQSYLHERAEKQLRERGYVRIIVLKGRQQGCSTYIEGRFYWKVTHTKGVRAYILTHEAEATANLFDMVSRYHQNNNPLLSPSTDKDSGKELNFDKLDSGYKVGTAGAKETGRSQTIQYFHGSEVAFWPHAEKHARGVMQAIPKNQGESFLESTSDGVGNYFYKVWRDAIQGKNDYEAVFIPWFWQSEYVSTVKEFSKTEDEIEYCDKVKRHYDLDLSDEQLQFRRDKISELGDLESFQREYPATAQEAFDSVGVNQLISTKLVRDAVSHELQSRPMGASILGVDVARFGDDRTVWVHRIGRYVKVLKVAEKIGLNQTAGITKQILDSWNYDACFIDLGMGAGVVDTLHEYGYDEVEGVNFGGETLYPNLYTNKRNEMFGELDKWLKDYPACIDYVDEVGDDEIEMDLCSIQYEFDSKSRKVMESKKKMKERLGHSPDIGDGIALTFARPVIEQPEPQDRYKDYHSGRDTTTGY